jgi:hypothetical protein
MSGIYTDEVIPQLFEPFITRAEAGLPEAYLSAAKGVLVAGPDLIRGLDYLSGSDYSDWVPSQDSAVLERVFPELNSCLRVSRHGEFWYVQRIIVGQYNREEFQALVVAFENVPICTHTSDEAMRLAEHCHPVPRSPTAGCWVEI